MVLAIPCLIPPIATVLAATNGIYLNGYYLAITLMILSMHNLKRFKKSITTVSFLILFCTTLICYLYIPYPYGGKEPVLRHLIAHAGGSIGNHVYTNSREAVLQSVRNGYKYIELDFQLTSDSQLVCMHSANDFRHMTAMADSMPLTANNFRQQRIAGNYTPITATDVTALMHDHPSYWSLTKYHLQILLTNTSRCIKNRCSFQPFR